MNLTQLTTFVSVLAEGSMTAAADKLFLTQPAVSQQIRNLEEELGVELLVRGVRQIKPTPQGEVFYEHARKILQHVQQAEAAIKSIGAALKGSLRIGTLNSLGLHLMSPLIGKLMRYNPELKIRMEYGDGNQLLKSIKKNEVDVIVLPDLEVEFEEKVDHLEKMFLMKDELWLVSAGKEHDYPQEISFEEIDGFPFVSFSEEYPNFQSEFFKKLESRKMNISTIFESTNVGTLKRVIESGLGWGFLPAHSIRKQVRAGRLQRTHIKDFQYSFDINLYYAKNALQKIMIELFYQSLIHSEKI